MFNFAEFLPKAMITVAALLPITMALVTYFGKLGLKGKWQLVASLITGIILGGLVMYAQVVPTDLNGWLQVGIVGLVEGLAASGTYEVIKKASG